MTDVLVVGAGPTGLVTAIALRRFGVECRIIDAAPGPALSSRGLGLQARSMEILEDLEVVDAVLEASEPLHTVRFFRGRRSIGRMRWVPPDAPFPYTYVLSQAGLEGILRARLAALGVEIEWGTEAEALSQDEQGVEVRLRDGATIDAPWVVGCDGAHSVVRDAVGIAFEGDTRAQFFYLGDVHLDLSGDVDDSISWFGPEGALMLLSIPGAPDLWRIFAEVDPPTGDERLPEPTRESFQTLLDTRGSGPSELAVDSVDWSSVYRVSVRHAARYRSGRVFIAGDAAHVFPPFGGQGMNTGIGDAYNLAWKLASVAQGWGSPELLDTYELERRAIGAKVIREVEARARSMTVRSAIGRALRDALFWLIVRSDAASRRGALANSQIQQTYRGLSWLSPDGRGALRPGDRAPDGRVGEERLFALRDGLRFLLLCFAPPGGAPPDPGVVSEHVDVRSIDDARDEALRRRYRASGGGFVLIRPDGHVAYRCGPQDGQALRAHLARILA